MNNNIMSLSDIFNQMGIGFIDFFLLFALGSLADKAIRGTYIVKDKFNQVAHIIIASVLILIFWDFYESYAPKFDISLIAVKFIIGLIVISIWIYLWKYIRKILIGMAKFLLNNNEDFNDTIFKSMNEKIESRLAGIQINLKNGDFYESIFYKIDKSLVFYPYLTDNYGNFSIYPTKRQSRDTALFEVEEIKNGLVWIQSFKNEEILSVSYLYKDS